MANEREKEIQNLLDFDSIDTFEKITKEAVNQDNFVIPLSMMHLNKNKLKYYMKETKDNAWGCSMAEFLEVVEDLGFRQIFKLNFKDTDNTDEIEYVYYHNDGILLHCETYNGIKLNNSKIYFNWKPKGSILDKSAYQEMHHYALSHVSGGWHGEEGDEANWTFSGDYDCREALRHKITMMKKYGDFLNPWKESPWLWLLNYMDTKDEHYDYKAINEAKIAQFPADVQQMIKGGQ